MSKLTNAQLNKLTKKELISRINGLVDAYAELDRQRTILVEENTELVNDTDALTKRLHFSKEREAALTESMNNVVEDHQRAINTCAKEVRIEKSIADKNKFENGIMKLVTLGMFIITVLTLLAHVKL